MGRQALVKVSWIRMRLGRSVLADLRLQIAKVDRPSAWRLAVNRQPSVAVSEGKEEDREDEEERAKSEALMEECVGWRSGKIPRKQ